MATSSYSIQWNGNVIMRKFTQEIRRRVRRATELVRNQVIQNISISGRGGNRSLPGDYPRRIMGGLQRSIFSDVTSDTEGIVGVLQGGPATKYAERLERGGTIVSHGKMMAVPISPEAKKHSESGQGPRTFGKPLVRILRKGKTMLLVEMPTKRSGFGAGIALSKTRAWIIHYVLTPKVTIAARPYLERTFIQMQPRILDIFNEPLPF